jgi:hypothetical protein
MDSETGALLRALLRRYRPETPLGLPEKTPLKDAG